MRSRLPTGRAGRVGCLNADACLGPPAAEARELLSLPRCRGGAPMLLRVLRYAVLLSLLTARERLTRAVRRP